MDISRIESLLDQTKAAIAAGNRAEAEKVGWALVQAFEADYDVKTEADYTPPVAALQYRVAAALLDLHILRGDKLDVSVRAAQLVKKYKGDREHITSWREQDWEEIEDIVFRAVESTRSFLRPPKKDYLHARTPDCTCYLCRRNRSEKTGSHLVPHLLIGDIFSYDGCSDRDKVVVEEANLASRTRDWYFGRSVYDDTIQELRGKGFSDEELELEQKKTNLLTRDYVFCDDCEKRFGVIETYYSDYLAGRSVPDGVPYLFWLSVAWRMSVGGLGIQMLPAHEEKLRKILDRCLSLKREDIVLKKSKLDYCAYMLNYVPDTRDETLGILAIHTPTSPYIALLGHRLFRFFITESQAKTYCKRSGWNQEELNTGRSSEKMAELSFIDFWSFKRFILDCNWRDDAIGGQRNQTVYQYESIPQEEADYMRRKGMGTFNHDARFLDFADRGLVMPRAVRKILRWMEEHPEEKTAEALCVGTGYSPEEQGIILQYWVSKAEKEVDRMKREEKIRRFYDELTDEVLDAL